MALTKRQMVRLSEGQDDALHELASSEGCSVSDLIRRAVIHQFDLPLEPTTRRTNRQTSGVRVQNGPSSAQRQSPEAKRRATDPKAIRPEKAGSRGSQGQSAKGKVA